MNLLAQPTLQEAAAINALSKSQDWAAFVAYLRRAQGELDVQLRQCVPDRLGKLQGSSLTVLDVITLPDACRLILKQPT